MIGCTATRSVVIALASSLMAGVARSQEPALDAQVIDTRANEMYDQIMSPFCPGRTLANCPSPQAATMRERVKQQLAAGMSEDEIVDSLYGIYGEIILGAPRAEGIGILAWVMPGVFLLVGVALLVRWLRSTEHRASAAAPTGVPGLAPDEQARLDAELSEL
jgi:cytochrome c-type biogenesis protein CcmH